jgi:hypothetical protein
MRRLVVAGPSADYLSWEVIIVLIDRRLLVFKLVSILLTLNLVVALHLKRKIFFDFINCVVLYTYVFFVWLSDPSDWVLISYRS